MAFRNSFSTIKIEGGLLSSDYLRQIASGNGQVPGLSLDAYHLSPGQRLSDAISSAWNVMRGRWTAFKDALNGLPEKDHAISITRDRLLLPLFQELGYGRLLTAKGTNISGSDYPISHVWGHCPIHLMGWNVPIDKRVAGVAGASRTNPHGLVQQFLNLSEDYLWGFVSNGRLLRVLRNNKTVARRQLVPLALKLTCCGWEMIDYWNARAAEGWVETFNGAAGSPGIEDEDRRLQIRAEIDAIVARDVFGLTASEMEYVLEDFPTLAKRQIDRYNEFLTKRLILEAMVASAGSRPSPSASDGVNEGCQKNTIILTNATSTKDSCEVTNETRGYAFAKEGDGIVDFSDRAFQPSNRPGQS